MTDIVGKAHIFNTYTIHSLLDTRQLPITVAKSTATEWCHENWPITENHDDCNQSHHSGPVTRTALSYLHVYAYF